MTGAEMDVMDSTSGNQSALIDLSNPQDGYHLPLISNTGKENSTVILRSSFSPAEDVYRKSASLQIIPFSSNNTFTSDFPGKLWDILHVFSLHLFIVTSCCNCSVPSQLQAKIHGGSPSAMGFLLGCGTHSYGQRSECADLLNSYLLFHIIFISLHCLPYPE